MSSCYVCIQSHTRSSLVNLKVQFSTTRISLMHRKSSRPCQLQWVAGPANSAGRSWWCFLLSVCFLSSEKKSGNLNSDVATKISWSRFDRISYSFIPFPCCDLVSSLGYFDSMFYLLQDVISNKILMTCLTCPSTSIHQHTAIVPKEFKR